MCGLISFQYRFYLDAFSDTKDILSRFTHAEWFRLNALKSQEIKQKQLPQETRENMLRSSQLLLSK